MCACVALNALPNIIMTYQGHFPLSGLAVPAGVDWEKIRAFSLDYKKSCKQSHVGAAGRKQSAASMREPLARLTGCLAPRSAADYLVSWVVGELPHSLAVHRSLHASGLLCQALMYFVAKEGT